MAIGSTGVAGESALLRPVHLFRLEQQMCHLTRNRPYGTLATSCSDWNGEIPTGNESERSIVGDKADQHQEWLEQQGEARGLYRQLFERDSPWSPAWQVDEAVEVALRSFFNEDSDPDSRERLLKRLRKHLAQRPEEQFGTWLKEVLAQRGRSQSQLARQIGANPSAVSKWVNGKQRPRPEQCARIAEVLGLSTEWVMEAAGHLPGGSDYVPDYWLSESDIRQEIVQLVHDIPEALLVPLVPMLRGLANTDETTIHQLEESAGGPRGAYRKLTD